MAVATYDLPFVTILTLLTWTQVSHVWKMSRKRFATSLAKELELKRESQNHTSSCMQDRVTGK